MQIAVLDDWICITMKFDDSGSTQYHNVSPCNIKYSSREKIVFLFVILLYGEAHYGPLNSHTVESLFFQVCVPEVTLHSSLSFNEKTLVGFN